MKASRREDSTAARLLRLGKLIVDSGDHLLLGAYHELARAYRSSSPKLAGKMESLAAPVAPRIFIRGKIRILRRASAKRILAGAIAQRVKVARSRKGWRQEDLAQRTGIARPNIARLEMGRQTPKLSTLSIVADALGLDMQALVAMPKPYYSAEDKPWIEGGIAEWERATRRFEDK